MADDSADETQTACGHDRGGPDTRPIFDRYHIVSPGDVPDVARLLDRRGTLSRHTSP